MSWFSHVCLYCVSDGVPRRSLIIALIVGTILNLITAGERPAHGRQNRP
jgi:hypothetical protein